MNKALMAIHVDVRVKAEHVDAFLVATLENAARSRKEPGIARFDVMRDRDDPTRFVLVEVYRSEQAPAAHKSTQHYEKWRQLVEPMLAEPRARRSFDTCYPPDEDW
jgi:(4S)-4-hydroxy-5-phosphonooxypentane-2,3-dione isomerase